MLMRESSAVKNEKLTEGATILRTPILLLEVKAY